MTGKKPPRISVRFELAPENPEHARLDSHLKKLALSGDASEWIRQTLLNNIHDPKQIILAAQSVGTRPVPKPIASKRSVVRGFNPDEEA